MEGGKGIVARNGHPPRSAVGTEGYLPGCQMGNLELRKGELRGVDYRMFSKLTAAKDETRPPLFQFSKKIPTALYISRGSELLVDLEGAQGL